MTASKVARPSRVEQAGDLAHPVGALRADGDPAAPGPVERRFRRRRGAAGPAVGRRPCAVRRGAARPRSAPGWPRRVPGCVKSTASGRLSKNLRIIRTCSGPITPRGLGGGGGRELGSSGSPVRVRRGPRWRRVFEPAVGFVAVRSATARRDGGHRGRPQLHWGGFGVQAGQHLMLGGGDATVRVSRAPSTVTSSGWVRVFVGSPRPRRRGGMVPIAAMTTSRSSAGPELILEHYFEPPTRNPEVAQGNTPCGQPPRPVDETSTRRRFQVKGSSPAGSRRPAAA